MNKKIRILVIGVVLFGVVTVGMGAGLYVPNTSADDLGRSDKPFGTVHASATKTSGVSTGLSFVATDSITAGTNITSSGAVDAGTELSSYTYTAIVSTNTTTQVYALQAYDVTANSSGSATQGFSPEFIVAPKCWYMYTADSGGIYVPTNVVTIATNSAIVLLETNATIFAYGRIK